MSALTRREFMRGCALAAAGALGLSRLSAGRRGQSTGGQSLGGTVHGGTFPRTASRLTNGGQASAASLRPAGDGYVHPALYYKRLTKQRVRCELCPRECEVGDMERGYCGVRENRGGEYYSVVYGRACSAEIDPIEKKPLFHYLPGSLIYSFATAGCNLECKNCQNWQISQARPEQVKEMRLPPAALVSQARGRGVRLIAGTYTEPTVFYEYLEDVAREGRRHGLRTVAITAGYIHPAPMRRLCRALDGIKIDIKSFREEFYRRNCSGHLKPVLDAILAAHRTGIWLELVYLVIPTMNDGDAEIKDLARWVKGNLGADVPLHFSRFYPTYRLTNLPPTPESTLTRCRELSLAQGLRYVYVGNLPGHPGENTYCPKCKRVLIAREMFTIRENNLRQGKCRFCGGAVPGVWT